MGREVERDSLRAVVCAALLACACGGGSAAPCSDVGTYTVHGNQSPPNCCAKLTRLALGAPGYTDVAQTQRSCFADDPAFEAFSCTQGSCGDGICEDAESVPCGCAADCPSAAWGPVAPAGAVRPSGQGATCSPVGTYPHSGDSKAPACCSGLFRLEMRTPLIVDGRHSCVQDDQLSFACLQGACGDGICEPAEAVPCVCPPDCPSAVWESTVTSDAAAPAP